MKKTALILLIFIIAYMIIGNVFTSPNIIPEDAIRLRIIANSDSEHDQQIKLKVKEEVEKKIFNILKEQKSIKDARSKLTKNINNISSTIENVISKEKYSFNIDYGYNYFPKKTFKGITYNEGYYESLVITLGKGEGKNWWCVLYPPLCMISTNDKTDVEYTSLVKEIINKYF